MLSEDTKINTKNRALIKRYKVDKVIKLINADKALFIIYADLECTIENIDECRNNPKKSSTTKVSKHIPTGFSMSTISSFRSIENKHDVFRGKDCIKNFGNF